MRATHSHPSSWKFLPLGKLLHFERPIVSVDPMKTYQEMTLRLFGQGLVPRRTVLGSELTSGEVQRLSEGLFVTSIHQFRNGAVAVVPKEFDGSILSKNFLLFRPSIDTVLPAYLAHYLSSSRVVRFLQNNSTGSATPIFPKHLMMRLEVPVPPLDDQIRLVRHLNELRQRINSLTQKVVYLEELIDRLKWATYDSAFQAGVS